MAGQPFDYRINVTDPFAAATRGLQLGATMEQLQRQREDRALAIEQAERQRQQQEMLNAEIQTFNQNPSYEGILRLSSLMPKDQFESLSKGWEVYDTGTRQKIIGQASEVSSALLSGKPEVGIEKLTTLAEAARNSGDEAKAKAYEAYIETAKVDPFSAALGVMMPLTTTEDGRKAVESIIKIREAPATVREGAAKAKTAEEEAKAAPRTYEAAIKKAEADAKEADARIRKIDAEIKRLEQTGGLDPDKAFDMETKLRAEYFKNSAVFKDVRDAYQRVESSQDNAVGDLSLIFGYMKMLDPGSVVREGEFATAQNAAGIDERIRNLYNKAISGERLSAGQRAAFKGQAKTLFKTAKSADDKVRSGLTRLAGSYGLRPENIFIESNEAVTPPVAGQQRTISVDY